MFIAHVLYIVKSVWNEFSQSSSAVPTRYCFDSTEGFAHISEITWGNRTLGRTTELTITCIAHRIYHTNTSKYYKDVFVRFCRINRKPSQVLNSSSPHQTGIYSRVITPLGCRRPRNARSRFHPQHVPHCQRAARRLEININSNQQKKTHISGLSRRLLLYFILSLLLFENQSSCIVVVKRLCVALGVSVLWYGLWPMVYINICMPFNSSVSLCAKSFLPVWLLMMSSIADTKTTQFDNILWWFLTRSKLITYITTNTQHEPSSIDRDSRTCELCSHLLARRIRPLCSHSKTTAP